MNFEWNENWSDNTPSLASWLLNNRQKDTEFRLWIQLENKKQTHKQTKKKIKTKIETKVSRAI